MLLYNEAVLFEEDYAYLNVIIGLSEIELLELTVVFPTDFCAWHKLLWLFRIR